MRRTTTFTLIIIFICLFSRDLSASPFLELSLDELMKIDVVSIFKTPQPLRRIPAAIHVITSEDIRRSGATSIPEVLRLVPGLQVLNFSHNRWAVSIRGSAREYSNKLQVLVDGRSIYSPTFSGVIWETLDIPLENIKQIEVIRGPGASVWGLNSVNGVINFITRPPSEADKTQSVIAAGTELKNSVYLSHSWKHSDRTSARIHFKGLEYDESEYITGQEQDDFWKTAVFGFRADSELPDKEKFSISGNAFISRAGEKSAPSPIALPQTALPHNQKADGLNISARWEFTGNNNTKKTLQTTIDFFKLDHFIIDEKRQTFELEYTSRVDQNNKHNIIWGAGTRITRDHIEDPDYFRVYEKSKTTPIYRVFLNDEITLREELLFLTLSAGLDHDPLTKFEFQPNVRLMYTPGDSDSFWLSAARATRTPARLERGARAINRINMLPVPFELDFAWELENPEKVDSIDVGWKKTVRENLNFDLNAFYYKFRDLVGIELLNVNQLVPPGVILTTARLANNKKSDIKGYEFSLNWSPRPNWQLQGTFSRLHTSREANTPGLVTNLSWDVPETAATVFSRLDINDRVHWDVWFKSTGSIKEKNLDAYNLVDSSLSYRINHNFRLSFIAQNLFNKSYRSYIPVYSTTIQREFGRNLYLKAEWGF